MTKEAKSNKGPVWNTNAMADFLGISPRRLQQLEKEGIVEKKARGKWYLLETTKKYIQYLQLHAHGSNQPDGEEDSPASITDENILLKRERRIAAEMQNRKTAGELHESKDVEALLNGMVATVRTKLLTLPTKLAATVAGIRDANKIQELLDSDIREALSELSVYDPVKFLPEDEVIDDED